MPTPPQPLHQSRPAEPKRRRGGWTPERRLRQAAAIRRWRPWARSTGPRTASGKARARLNAVKHGLYTDAMRRIRRALKMHARFLAAHCYVQKHKHHLSPEQAVCIIREHTHHGRRKSVEKSAFWPERTIERPETCRNTM